MSNLPIFSIVSSVLQVAGCLNLRFELNNDRWAVGVNTSERSLPWLRERERGEEWSTMASFKVFFVAFNVFKRF